MSWFNSQGPRDVYLGISGAVLGTIPTAFVYFSVYEWCKERMEASSASSGLSHLAAASAGAVVSAIVRVPGDTLKHRVQSYLHKDIFQVCKLVGAVILCYESLL